MTAALNFPLNPSLNQQYVAPNGTSYIWDGSKWIGQNKYGTPVVTTNTYVLPQATANQLGGVKVGAGLSISGAGVLSAESAVVSPTAPLNPTIGSLWYNTDSKVLFVFEESGWQTATTSLPEGGNTGDFLVKNSDANYDATWISNPSVSPSTNSSLGTVKIGSNINVTGDGTISVPVATNSTLGVVKPGTNVTIAGNGAISVSKGAGINTVADIPDVNTTSGGAALNDGALLVYNASNQRWDTIRNLRSDEMDGGFF
jgi:hypothetical protein